jgi:menaquinone-dependent protoporphyrinogen oxidase
MRSVLIAYASKSGSTREVAVEIADVFRRRGWSATVAEAAHVRERASDYDLVVLGGAIYSGRWHSGARRFLRKHRQELGRTAVAVFGMGPRENDSDAWESSRAQLSGALSKHSWLRPLAVTVFGGVDPPKKAQHRDLRNWEAIRAWADELARPAT